MMTLSCQTFMTGFVFGVSTSILLAFLVWFVFDFEIIEEDEIRNDQRDNGGVGR